MVSICPAVSMEAISLSACPAAAASLPGELFSRLITTLVASQCALANPADYPVDYGDKLVNEEKFDFIVVGAGSAGSAVASRLSENANWKVLLLEAGGDPNVVSEVPSHMFLNYGSDIDWNYSSESNNISCLGMVDGRCANPRGKVLGGSSTINAMMYVRGNADDYDGWERLGNEGWGYKEILKYFKKSEGLSDSTFVTDDEYEKLKGMRQRYRNDSRKMWELSRLVSADYHSRKGPLSVKHFGFDGVLAGLKNSIFDAIEELGFRYLPDINGKDQMGFAEIQGTMHKGSRANTAKMFLNPIKNRTNLVVVKKATVQKLLFDGKMVVGVELMREGKTQIVSSTKEVVLCAGSINSPQLLMVSGVGPRDHLEALEIDVVHDLQGVGQNLQDHLASFAAPIGINRSRPRSVSEQQLLDSFYEFLTRGGGPLASIGTTDLTGFVNTVPGTNPSIPDIQFHFMYYPFNDPFGIYEMTRGLRFAPHVAQQYINFTRAFEVIIPVPTLTQAKSIGKITLRSKDPNVPPNIITNFMKEQEDVDNLIRGIRIVEKLIQTKALKSLEAEILKLKLEKCDKFDLGSDEYWDCVIRHVTISIFHPVGTCKMGPSSDPTAVVDARLKVHGIEGLRVADASIMPVITRGNTNAPSIMIGERVADFIKEDWGTKDQQRSEL